jgi:hypothetical protein
VGRHLQADGGFPENADDRLVQCRGVHDQRNLQTGLVILPHERNAQSARLEGMDDVRIGRADRRNLDREIGLVETRIFLFHHLAGEVPPESGHHFLAGRVVRRQQEGLLVAERLRKRACAFALSVILPGRDEIILVAALAGKNG